MGERTYADLPRVYIDMDGVLADFAGESARCGSAPDELKLRLGAYRNLAVLPGARGAVTDLQAAGAEIFVLTSVPVSNPYAATEKLLWISDHFPTLEGRVLITPDKGCVGQLRDVLVDDQPTWANADHFRGTVVHFQGLWRASLDAIFAALRMSQSLDAICVDPSAGRKR